MNECVHVNNEIKREGGGGFPERFWSPIVRVGGKKPPTVIMQRKFETEHTMHYERYKIKQFGDEVWLEYLISMEYNLTIDVDPCTCIICCM